MRKRRKGKINEMTVSSGSTVSIHETVSQHTSHHATVTLKNRRRIGMINLKSKSSPARLRTLRRALPGRAAPLSAFQAVAVVYGFIALTGIWILESDSLGPRHA